MEFKHCIEQLQSNNNESACARLLKGKLPKNINEEELNSLLKELNINEQELIKQCKGNKLCANLVAKRISKKIHEQVDELKALQIDNCNEMLAKAGISIMRFGGGMQISIKSVVFTGVVVMNNIVMGYAIGTFNYGAKDSAFFNEMRDICNCIKEEGFGVLVALIIDTNFEDELKELQDEYEELPNLLIGSSVDVCKALIEGK